MSRTAPEHLQHRPVLRRQIWKRCNVANQHYMGAIVGREGSGKSYTALRIAELVDPTFSADRVFFRPDELLDAVKHLPGGSTGRVFVFDEAGVEMGNRTWYETAQILLNKTLQVVRDENIAVLFTLPRLGELDTQTQGRLLGFGEMLGVAPAEGVAKMKYKNIDPARDGTGKIYKKYPRQQRNGRVQKLQVLKFRKPQSNGLLDAYEERKTSFQQELYERTIDEISGEEEASDDPQSPKEIAADIRENRDILEFCSVHGGHNKRIIDKDLIEVEYDSLSVRDAKVVKKLLTKDPEVTVPPLEPDTQTETHG